MDRRRPLGLELHTHLIDRLAILNGFVSGVALYPQVFKLISLQDYSGVSTTSFGIIFLNSAVWTLYSMHRGLISLLIASVLNLLASLLLLILTLVG